MVPRRARDGGDARRPARSRASGFRRRADLARRAARERGPASAMAQPATRTRSSSSIAARATSSGSTGHARSRFTRSSRWSRSARSSAAAATRSSPVTSVSHSFSATSSTARTGSRRWGRSARDSSGGPPTHRTAGGHAPSIFFTPRSISLRWLGQVGQNVALVLSRISEEVRAEPCLGEFPALAEDERDPLGLGRRREAPGEAPDRQRSIVAGKRSAG